MSDINWKDGAVCYGDGRQWFANTDYESEKFGLVNNDGTRKYSLYGILNYPKDFQLNEIRTGDFIPASELDTEQKYNEVVEVFWLFGFKFGSCATKEKPIEKSGFCLSIVDNEIWNASGSALKRQLTYHQIIAIGKLKRMMLEREKSKLIENASMMKQLRNSELDTPVKFEINYEVNPFSKYAKENFPKIDLEEKHKRRNKSKQAYDILKSLDYEYDLVKQRWYKKEYI